MSLTFKVERSGLNLKIFSEQMDETLFKPFMAALAERVEGVMRGLAPKRTGRLAASITKTVSGVEAIIGPTAPYAIFVEYGTRPHEIRPVHARALRFEVEGEVVFTMRVYHPGTKPQTFVGETARIVPSLVPEVWEKVWEEKVNRR